MEQLIYDVKNFGGITNSYGATAGVPIQCDNWDMAIDGNATTLYHGFLKKFPITTQMGDKIATSASRGMFLFLPSDYAVSDTKKFMQGFDDGTVRYLTGGAWTTITSSLTADYYICFEAYTPIDKVIYSNGREHIYIWGNGWTAGLRMQDKGTTVVALTGNLTFTNSSNAVTGVATAFTTELSQGSWIRINSSGNWYQVDVVTDDTNLVLTQDFVETTGAGGAGNSQKPGNALIRGRFFKFWKDRLIIASGDSGAFPLVGVALVGVGVLP